MTTPHEDHLTALTPPTSSGVDFATALRAAIGDSGLALERVQSRLAALGVSVSIASLSYWQSGQRDPGPRSCLAAVPALEQVLGLRPGELTAHLPHRTTSDSADGPVEIAGLLSGTQVPPDQPQLADARLRDLLDIVSEHCSIVVGDRCTIESRWVRRVMVAEASGADRFLVVRSDATDAVLEPLLHCRVGNEYRSKDQSLVAHEVVLDRRLERGETIIVEYRLGGLDAGMEYVSARRTPVRELVLEVGFDPRALPAGCEFVHSDLDGANERASQVALDSTHCVRMVRHNLTPGRYAVRWSRE